MSNQIENNIADLKKKRTHVINRITYYPAFDNANELTNHYYRACWYLPYKEGVVTEVIVPASKELRCGERPEYMGPTRASSEHIKIQLAENFDDYLANSTCVLLWNFPTQAEISAFQKLGIKVFNITTNDVNTVEYGNYCKIMWQLTPGNQKQSLLEESHCRFKEKISSLRQREYLASAIFGTGPSIDLALKYDFSRCFTHVCNTIILSEELMDHIQPNFVSAGDVVSHFGVSTYAHQFREKLFEILISRDCMFLTTAQFGYLFMLHYPEAADKVLACDQRGFVPNYDLLNDWSLPCLDSVFNIHMSPTCATVSDTVFVLGCDGKNPDEKLNEDFWQHSPQAQLHHLVDSGHKCHPTFDIHRQRSTWDRYQNSVRQTCGIGENLYGKNFISLQPSFTVGLTERYMEKEQLAQKYPFILRAV